jgi:hypothetical protein
MSWVMKEWLVGLPGLEPGTSSLSECRHPGSRSRLIAMTWAYAREHSAGCLAVCCVYPRSPKRSRAAVGPPLGMVDHQLRGVGASSRAVRCGPCAGPTLHSCPYGTRCLQAWQQYWQQSLRDGTVQPGRGPCAPPLPPIGLAAAGLFAGGEVSRADSRVRRPGTFTCARCPAVRSALDAVPEAYHNPAAVRWGAIAASAVIPDQVVMEPVTGR